MAKYVRVLDGSRAGRVGELRSYNKRDWIDWIRGYPKTATVMGIVGEGSSFNISMVYTYQIEEISEREYFKERLGGN